MKKLLVVLPLFLLLAVPVFSQRTASMAGPAHVRAGQNVTFNITLDKAPNFAGGYVSLRIGPNDASLQRFATSRNPELPEGQREISISIPIPPDVPKSLWHIVSLSFVQPDNRRVDLKFKGGEFEVLPKRKLVIPDSATVTIH